MNKRTIITLLTILLVGVGWALRAQNVYSAINTIPVQDADAVFEPSLPTSSGFASDLRTLIDGLSDMIFPVRSPDGTFWDTLEALPLDLSSLVDVLPSEYFPVRSPDGTFWRQIEPVSNQPVLSALLDLLPDKYFPVRSADAVTWGELSPVSGILATLLGEIPDFYIPVRSADAVTWRELSAVSATLGTLLGELPETHIPVRSADAVFMATSFQYPQELLHDNMPPQISNASIETITGLAQWETDEFATSEVWYGDTPGDYSLVISDTAWVKTHQLLPPSIHRAGWEYILIRSVDRSGNYGEYYYPGFVVSGSVLDQSDNPIEGALVWVSQMQAAITDGDGAFSIPGVPPGEHTLSVVHPEYNFPDDTIEINLNGDVTGLDFTGTAKTKFIFIPVINR